jgi:hypothetical protein
MPEQEKLEKIPGAVQALPGKGQWSDSFFMDKEGEGALTMRVKVHLRGIIFNCSMME